MEEKQFNPLTPVLPEFYLDDIEKRLETDPLTLGGFVDLEYQENDICSPAYCKCATAECVCVNDCGCAQNCGCAQDCGCAQRSYTIIK